MVDVFKRCDKLSACILLMFVVLVLGMLLFIGIGRLLILANDKMIDKQFCDVDVYKREICGSEN